MKKSLLVKLLAPVVAIAMMTACSESGTENGATSDDALFGDVATADETVADTTVETTVAETTEQVEESEETVPEETEAAISIIGDENGSTVSVVFVNNTGDDIVGIAIRTGSDGDFSENMLADTFADGEQRIMYYDDSSDSSGSYYTIKIEFASGNEDRLHRFEFVDSDEFVIESDNSQTYITYIDESGNEVSTHDNENLVDNPSSGSSSADSGCIGDDGLFY